MTLSSTDYVVLAGDPADREALLRGYLDDPHRLLGIHRTGLGEGRAWVVRVYHPEAKGARLLPAAGEPAVAMATGGGLFAGWLPAAGEAPPTYRVELELPDGRHEQADPYSFPPQLGELDLFLFGEGTHYQLWESLGARRQTVRGIEGYAFAVWAPNARRVSLVGDFCHWDGRVHPMRRLGDSGVFEIFMPDFGEGELYKFEILGADGALRLKADPMASWAEVPPATASRTFTSSYVWGDGEWMERRHHQDISRQPLAAYEVHLGSWRRRGTGSFSYRELADELVPHVRDLGFDAVELLPIAEHPYSGSWGYQITGYYAPTARHGNPDDFRYFVDRCHGAGLQVILDWVPGHFVTDAHGLGRFDGTALYEHEDPRLGFHPDWGTYIFNLARHEVRSFLLANAMAWLQDFHIDGLRVDAVASMLYLDYSRKEGEWVANTYGGRENLEAVDFLRHFNTIVHERAPGCFTVAEESTAWPGVTHRPERGGLGFDFKWNMGWMHDTLGYFQVDPLFRGGCHDRLTFAMLYEGSERFINPLSHDEVVHGKGSLYDRMPGDSGQRLANLRTLFLYQMTRPGKKLLFMGSELAPEAEWDSEGQLPWHLLEDPARAAGVRFLRDLLALYHRHPSLWRGDPDAASFHWVSCDDRAHSVLAYERRWQDERLLVALNLTPVPRPSYRLLVDGVWRVLFCSDREIYGGTGHPVPGRVRSGMLADGQPFIHLTLPPLCGMVLSYEGPAAVSEEE